MARKQPDLTQAFQAIVVLTRDRLMEVNEINEIANEYPKALGNPSREDVVALITYAERLSELARRALMANQLAEQEAKFNLLVTRGGTQ